MPTLAACTALSAGSCVIEATAVAGGLSTLTPHDRPLGPTLALAMINPSKWGRKRHQTKAAPHIHGLSGGVLRRIGYKKIR